VLISLRLGLLEFLLKYYLAVRLMNFISAAFSLLISLCFKVQISQPDNSDVIANNTTYLQSKLFLNDILFEDVVQNS